MNLPPTTVSFLWIDPNDIKKQKMIQHMLQIYLAVGPILLIIFSY